ncbi:MAG: ABC transporter substrate-binding protein, partial [Promethearchaeota archaeon]
MVAEEEVFLYEAGCEAITKYIGFNTKQINVTWRNAISYAINYSSIIDQLENDWNYTTTRLKSPLPVGVLYANWSFDYPIFNISKARELMQSMHFGLGWDTTFPGNHEAQWISANFRTLNYTYNADGADNAIGGAICKTLEHNLTYIGITIENTSMTWEDYKDRLYNSSQSSAGYNALQLYYWDWKPEFNDPSNYINFLFSNTSITNAAQVNVPYLQNLIEQGIEEVDPTIREAIYDEIQRYLVEDFRPHAWLFVEKNYDVWDKDLRGFPSNAMDRAYFYPCYWID